MAPPVIGMKILSCLLLMGSLATGCMTPYQPLGYTGGYTDTQLGENVFRITFRGNVEVSKDRAADYSLLRAAEIALANGFRYFVISDSKVESNIFTYTTPTQSSTTGSAHVIGNSVYGSTTTTTTGGGVGTGSTPSATNIILCYKEKPDVTGIVFDAEFVAKSIRKKYGIAN